MDPRAGPTAAPRLAIQFQPLVLLDPQTSLPRYRDLAAAAAAANANALAGGTARVPPPPPDIEQLHQLQRELGRLGASVNEHVQILDGELSAIDELLRETGVPIPTDDHGRHFQSPGGDTAGESASESGGTASTICAPCRVAQMC